MQNHNETESRSVLVVSQRKVARTPANAVLYEFEDLIAEWEHADVYEVDAYHGDNRFDLRRKAFQGMRLTRSPASPSMRLASVGSSKPNVEKEYDLAILVTSTAFDLFTLSQLPYLRKRAKLVVAYVAETWPSSTSKRKLRLEPWELVDHIFVGVPAAAEELSSMLGRVVTPMPVGVDTDRFAPRSSQPRPITVTNPGRRAIGQHRLIRQICDEEDLWYCYDTITGNMSVPARQHRANYADTLRRTDAVVCNPARFNDLARTSGTQIVPYRVFEAMAAGCRMFGQRIPDEAFRNAGLPTMDIPELSLDPTYSEVRSVVVQSWSELERARYRDIARHNLDWSHRWETILLSVGLSPSSRLRERQYRLLAGAEIKLA